MPDDLCRRESDKLLYTATAEISELKRRQEKTDDKLDEIIEMMTELKGSVDTKFAEVNGSLKMGKIAGTAIITILSFLSGIGWLSNPSQPVGASELKVKVTPSSELTYASPKK